MSSAMEKILWAMAASERRGPNTDAAGEELLALLKGCPRKEPMGDALPLDVSSPDPWGKLGLPGVVQESEKNLLGALSTLLAGGAGGENKISYDREFLFSCSDSPICKEMPKALIDKLVEFPQVRPLLISIEACHIVFLSVLLQMRRKSGADSPASSNALKEGSSSVEGQAGSSPVGGSPDDQYHPFEPQPSIVDLLPLRPTAQVFTYDPVAKEWVPRARPQDM